MVGCVTCHLSVYDLFVVGIALDLVGAFLVARGLLVSPVDLGGMSGRSVGAIDAKVMAERLADRVHAEAGLLSLALGFLLQLVGYLGVIGGATYGTGKWDVLFAVLLAAMAAAIVAGTYRSLSNPRRRAVLVAFSKQRGPVNPTLLARIGAEWKWPRLPGEADEEYVARTFPGAVVSQLGRHGVLGLVVRRLLSKSVDPFARSDAITWRGGGLCSNGCYRRAPGDPSPRSVPSRPRGVAVRL